MNFIKLEDVEWKKVKYLRKGQSFNYYYELMLNEPLASWDVWDYWEVERIMSMRKELKQGEIFFDIGTEQGWCNLVYAQIVGAENMVLIEPTKEFWGNIKALWQKNTDVPPLACYSGLFSNKTTSKDVLLLHQFPKEADDPLIDRNKYQYLHEEHEGITEITLDDYVNLTGIVPDVLNIDVEGAELRVLEGARLTLEQYKPKIYVSIHDDLGRRDYDTTPDDTIRFLEKLGYTGKHLATNHEAHWYFK
jgi:FkbM family methyltransferase